MGKHILILGAGYGGLLTALEARRLMTADAARITIVNRHPFHQLITELHQPAAGRVNEKDVRLPLDKLLKGKRVDVCLGDIENIELDTHRVHFTGGGFLAYDYLVVGLGSETEFFGIPGLKEHSLILKSVDDAKKIRTHIEENIAAYPSTQNAANLTVAVGGAGLTGIELVGELADMMPHLCAKYGVDPSLVKLLSIEAAPSILPGFPSTLIERAKNSLEARGVEFVTGVPIVQMETGRAHLKDGRLVETNTLVWTGGVRGHSVVAGSGLAVDGRGRALVNEYLQSSNHENVFVVGDSAIVMGPEGRPYPPTAQLAGQMGTHVGAQLHAMIKHLKMDSFHPHFSGTLASLGRKDAIGMVGERKMQIKGKPASLLKEASKLRYLSQIGALFTRAE